MNKLSDLLQQQKIAVLDGGMGTLLQQRGLKNSESPMRWNIDHQDIIEEIHSEYVRAGAQIIETNSFGANRYKLQQYQLQHMLEEIVVNSVKIAKRAAADKALVAYGVGPIGLLMQPHGDLSFDEAWDLFSEQVILAEQAGADLILIETVSDLTEARAAVLAVKENTRLPIICTMTFQPDGRTLMGTDALTAVNVLQALGVDAVGANCSCGPVQLLPILQQMAQYAEIPLVVQPNAGIPQLIGNDTVFPLGAEEMAAYTKNYIDCGVGIVGGCCGTTPEHIKALSREVEKHRADYKRISVPKYKAPALSSQTNTVFIGSGFPVRIIGERINPTGKKKLSQQLKNGEMKMVVNEAINQVKNGAAILDVNVGVPDGDEKTLMKQAIIAIQKVVRAPLVIDSGDVAALEQGLRYYQGRAMINSVNGKQEIMQQIFPLAKKYGALVLGLALDEKGIPQKAQDRLLIAERIINTAEQYGLKRTDILIDCLVLTASAQQDAVQETIKALRLVKEKYNLATVLGISNVSFGLPNRTLLNSAFLAMALANGLDAPILNPNNQTMLEMVKASEVLVGRDDRSVRYIDFFADKSAVLPETMASANMAEGDDRQKRLYQIIVDGNRQEAENAVEQLLTEQMPLMDIVDKIIVPALENVGVKYDRGEFFLPQLMMSAETVQQAFARLKQEMPAKNIASEQPEIIIATVYGDIHDIGKNIVRVLLDNYGFSVLDLGKDVPLQAVLKAVKESQCRLLGLSALMTTTLPAMQQTIELVKKACPQCRIMVGGAVLTPEYALKINADYYARDARESVKIARAVLR